MEGPKPWRVWAQRETGLGVRLQTILIGHLGPSRVQRVRESLTMMFWEFLVEDFNRDREGKTDSQRLTDTIGFGY